MSRARRTERPAAPPLILAPAGRGFTLIEVLVALVIFAIASVIAYSGLHAVASVKGSLDREIRFWRELGQVFDRMEMDLLQILPHRARAADGRLLAPLQGSRGEEDGGDGFVVELSRHDEERTPLRVAYQCAQGVLTLRLYPINGPQASAPVHTLLRDVERCDLAYLGSDLSWLAAWPGGETAIKPRAIRVRLTLAGRGQFERLYYLP